MTIVFSQKHWDAGLDSADALLSRATEELELAVSGGISIEARIDISSAERSKRPSKTTQTKEGQAMDHEYMLIALLLWDVRRRGFVGHQEGMDSTTLRDAARMPPGQYSLVLKKPFYLLTDGRVRLRPDAFPVIQATGMLFADVESLGLLVRDVLVEHANNVGREVPIPYADLKAAVMAEDDGILQLVLVLLHHFGRLLETVPSAADGYQIHLSENIELRMQGLGRKDVCFQIVSAQPAYQKLLVEAGRRYDEMGGHHMPEVSDSTLWRPRPLPLSDADVLTRVFENFHRVVKVLERETRKNVSTYHCRDEYDAQHLIEALLSVWYDHVESEQSTETRGEVVARMDFLVRDASIAIELKYVKQGMTTGQINRELTLDHAHYSRHPKVKSVWCLVYDPNSLLKNPRGLERDLSVPATPDGRAVSMTVKVIPRL